MPMQPPPARESVCFGVCCDCHSENMAGCSIFGKRFCSPLSGWSLIADWSARSSSATPRPGTNASAISTRASNSNKSATPCCGPPPRKPVLRFKDGSSAPAIRSAKPTSTTPYAMGRKIWGVKNLLLYFLLSLRDKEAGIGIYVDKNADSALLQGMLEATSRRFSFDPGAT